MERFVNAASVIMGLTSRARSVIPPCHSATGIAENIHPFPKEQVITIIMMILTYSISLGIAWGFLVYAIGSLASKETILLKSLF